MIIKNTFGIIAVIFSLLIITTIFTNTMNSSNLTSQRNILNDISNHLTSICSNPSEKMGYPLKINILNEDYFIKINDNNILCLNASDNSLICNKFKCNLTSNSNIIIENFKSNYTNNQINVCFLEKKTKNSINIDCSKEYSY